jgi:hypothetical protein
VLQLAERTVDGGVAERLVTAQQVEELPERHGDALGDPGAEAARQRARVLGHLGADGGDDAIDRARELGPQRRADPARYPGPGSMH